MLRSRARDQASLTLNERRPGWAANSGNLQNLDARLIVVECIPTTSVLGSNSSAIFARLDRFYGDDRDGEDENNCMRSRFIL